jgi:starch phosphorylase
VNIDYDVFMNSFIKYLKISRGKEISQVSKEDIFYSLTLVLKEFIVDRILKTEQLYKKHDVKKLYYISIEYMVGNSLKNNIINLNLFDICNKVVSGFGFNLDDILNNESEPALGTGGLGRLAACFLDSLASIQMPGFGYGINYEFGSLKQLIKNGYQVERPDDWGRDRSPWLIEKLDEKIKVPIFGHLEKTKDQNGCNRGIWKNFIYIEGIPSDLPVIGYNGNIVNYLRLYTAGSPIKLDFEKFYYGDFKTAFAQKIYAENICKLIYPSDTNESGKELRLLQEYFLVSCAIKDIISKYDQSYGTYETFAEKVAIQINDTHPSLAIAELMRVLVDEKSMGWEKAWDITTKTIAYTNHTLLPEALEKWPVYLVERLLPRHLDIIYMINKHFLKKVDGIWNGNVEKLSAMSIFEESETKYVRMANLSIIGSHSVNGVSHMHSELLKSSLVPDFHQLWPDKFSNKTNGITQRRWLLNANPLLAESITSKIGDSWITDLSKLHDLEIFSTDENYRQQISELKAKNKKQLASYIKKELGLTVSADSLFDIQVKRIHEYKRQLLNVLNIIHLYLRIIEDGEEPRTPRTFIFAGKSAPSYHTAKLIIKLINSVAETVNKDKRTNDLLKIVFIPNYNVALAEKIIPAADVSEQISTAGMEASGTGNMKFALNGAIIIGTLDGANIEIKEEVGDENIYIFGKDAEEINKMKSEKSYNPKQYYENNLYIKRVVDTLSSNLFCPHEHGLFKPLYDALINHGDRYFLLADFDSYTTTQQKIDHDFQNRQMWLKKSILNISRMGKFSSDRTIKEYADDIWKIKSLSEYDV